ncbi:MAG: response regulator transcription factor [Alphaproteobacteria bacterium]|nr:response regulator transcription factor [Alphaproteobacteria bacterium]
MRVLIVEDNRAFAELVARRLADSGFDSDRAISVEQAEEAIKAVDYAAVVLDLGLPDKDGLELLRGLRSRNDSTPVLITTARNGLDDRVRGLREGADDYLAKPFSVDELVARLHALMRRPGKLLGHVLNAGNVSLDSDNHQVNVGPRVLPMRLRETVVLEILMRHKANVVPRRYFEDQLFGIEGEQDSNTVDVYIHRLRKQLEEAGATVRVHTIRGVGYMLFDDVKSVSGL